MKRFLLTLACLVPLMGALAQDAPDGYRAPVIVELFTSEGCSSCPPADEVLAHLSDLGFSDEQVIPLSYHVDYWNDIGWTDPFSHKYCTQRQWNYARLYRASQVYTPQMIVNGTKQFLGSNQTLAKQTIQDAWQKTDAAKIQFSNISNEIHSPTLTLKITYTLHEAFGPGELALFVAATEDKLASDVTRGENQGRVLKHHAVVRTIKRINQISTKQNAPVAKQVSLSIKPGWQRNNLRAVVFIQNLTNGAIIGAASKRLAGDTTAASNPLYE
ncbi:MAG: DUF1223 domain-containing protein [Candidatus Hinthialibacter antarcticus]|nr:DUF1223 domain-containing protein [Candidatus Hinthialibacter antarcticus]